MSASFTPGPWSHTEGTFACLYTSDGSDPFDCDDLGVGAATANIRLAAAAPELYAALEAVELARNSDAKADWLRATALTNAALAKARGEA